MARVTVRAFWNRFGRTLLLVAVLAALSPVAWSSAIALVRNGRPSPITNPADFRAFYCAARTLGEGHDPYRTEPLRTCEHAAARAFGLEMFDGLVLPAPLPPFALALFVPLGRVDFRIASIVWFGFSLLAFAVSCALLARMTRWSPLVTTLAMLGPVAYVSVPLGQLMPTIVALLCVAAFAVRARRFELAAVLCSLATIEPHVALPVCVAAFVTLRNTRVPFIVCGACAVLVSVVVGGPTAFVEYGSRVLPLHALSQVDQFNVQYSLTALVKAFGGSTREALLAGSISYVISSAAGIVAARHLRTYFSDDAFVVLVPAAFAVIGGTFVHLAQIAVAVPGLILLASYLPRARIARVVWIAALIALAIPWSSIAETPSIAASLWHHPVAPRVVALPSRSADTFAEEMETAFIAGGGYGSNGASNVDLALVKLPTWLGLIGFAVLAGCAGTKAFRIPSDIRRAPA